MYIVISYLNFNLKLHNKCTVVVKLISLANTSNVFSLEVVQNADSVNFVYYGKTRVLIKIKFKTRLTDNLYLDSHRMVNIMWLIFRETTFLLFGLTVICFQLSVPFLPSVFVGR